MIKKGFGVFICLILTIIPIQTIAVDLNNLKQQCCCKTDCECTHEKNTTTSIRNIKCGDNVIGKLTSFESKNLISVTQIKLKKNNTKLNQKKLGLNLFKDTIKLVELPPPKANS